MIILTLLCAVPVFLSTGEIHLHCLNCSAVHHHVSLEANLPRAVHLVQHFYKWKKMCFLHLSLSYLNYFLCEKEMRLGGLRKRAYFAGVEHFYLWLAGKLPLSF